LKNRKNEPQENQDRSLDAAVRAAGDTDTGASFPVDENTLLDYLHGTANEQDTARLRAALAESPSLRRELLEIAADLDLLNTPAAQAAFAALDEPEAPSYAEFVGEESPARERPRTWPEIEPERPSLLDSLRSLFLKPAFAYAFTIALMAYPTFRFLTSTEKEAPLLQSPLSYHLRTDGPVLRGDQDSDLFRVTPAEGSRLIDLTLWTDTPLAEESRYQIVINDRRGVVWQEDDFQVLLDPGDSGRLDIRLDAGALQPGLIRIRLTRFDRRSGAETLSEEFSFELR